MKIHHHFPSSLFYSILLLNSKIQQLCLLHVLSVLTLWDKCDCTIRLVQGLIASAYFDSLHTGVIVRKFSTVFGL
jgi:hypothetical protein